jgi:hypothetical protein
MKQFHRYDNALLSALAHEDSLGTVESSAANPDTLSGGNEGMHGTWDLFPDRCLEIFDLFTGDRSSLSLISNEAKNAWGPQYPESFFRRLSDANKAIATEHGHFHLASAVAPLVNLLKKREKRDDSLFLELMRNPLLMPGLSTNGIPARIVL